MTNMDRFLFYCKDLESPEMFIRLTYLWAVSSVMQRRIYFGNEKLPIFGNVFFGFIAPPGIGKSLAAKMVGKGFLKSYVTADDKKIEKDGLPSMKPRISFSADSTSPESLIKQLGLSIRSYHGTITMPDGSKKKIPMSHNSMSMLLSEEMTTLFRKNLEVIASYLNQWWDAGDFEYQILGRDGGDKIANVCVTFLGCTTPNAMRKLMTTGILDDGFTARALLVYEDASRHRKSEFHFDDLQIENFEIVREHLKKVLDAEGKCTFSPEAKAWFDDYYESGKLQGEAVNKDDRLGHYLGRIKVHAIKLAMLLHYGEHHDVHEIQLETIRESVTYLRKIEINMHKALAAYSKNPIYDLSVDILEYLKVKGPHSRIGLLIAFSAKGDTKDLDACLEFLQLTNKIKTDTSKPPTKFVFVSN